MSLGQTAGQVGAAHLGHHHIGHQQLNGLGFGRRDPQRFLSACRLEDRVAVALQLLAQHPPHRVFIFHQQHRLGP